MADRVTLLIGHRGVGKSTFLKEYVRVHPAVKGFDLDDEIALRAGRSIEETFATEGEAGFRRRERELLETLVAAADGPTLIAIGAGFPGPFPQNTRRLWLRRVTDAHGRIFLDRPRLNPNVSPFEEYRERFAKREKFYAGEATDQIYLPEGNYDELLEDKAKKVPYDLTLLPESLRDWPRYWDDRKGWELRRLELRDDLIDDAAIERVFEIVPPNQILFSRRTVEGKSRPGLYCDWALELGAPPEGVNIVSKHARDRDLEPTLARWPENSAIRKLAVEIESFSELAKGHAWWLEDPERRAFLPRSKGGRWQWYRSLFGPRMPIHFVREGDGSGADQPHLWQTWLQPALARNFAAVLGTPVAHSRSPREHQKYFPKTPFVAIDVREDEFHEALPILRALGLTHAAVTAPLKKLAGDLLGQAPLNTLAWTGTEWAGANTDLQALKTIVGTNTSDSVWIWGRGALLSSLKEIWPNAEVFSARAGSERTDGPDLLIWATHRARPFKFPNARAKRVLDLNYGDDSPGKEYARLHEIPYRSGLEMFKLQAEAQQVFWRRFT